MTVNMAVNLDHIVLNVGDVDRSISFYSEVLCFEAVRLDEYRRGEVPFPSVRINRDTLIDIFPPKMWADVSSEKPGKPNLNHFCVALAYDEWCHLRERIEAREIPITRDRTINFGAHGDGISMYFRDPDDNLIEARYYEDKPA